MDVIIIMMFILFVGGLLVDEGFIKLNRKWYPDIFDFHITLPFFRLSIRALTWTMISDFYIIFAIHLKIFKWYWSFEIGKTWLESKRKKEEKKELCLGGACRR